MNTIPRIALPAGPLDLFKASKASVEAGEVLPKKAKKWEGVYVPALAIIVARDVLDCGGVPWQQATDAVAQSTLCGIASPRMWTRLEFALLMEEQRWDPVLNTDFFTKPQHYWEWTSTVRSDPANAWGVDLRLGFSGWFLQSNHDFCRAVCPSQSLDLGNAQ